jgi:hypothetical protein
MKVESLNHIRTVIEGAAQKSGVDFSYLLNQAKVESSLNPEAKSKSSSATGLYQFIDSTWLDMVKNHGDKYGLESYQAAIKQHGHVDHKVKQEILNLRKDPALSANMAAELASSNQDYLEKSGVKTTPTALYMAHFLGAGKAVEFLKEHEQSPYAPAAALFPKEANANRAVFYHGNGKAKSMDEIYGHFEQKIEGGVDVTQSSSFIAQTDDYVPSPLALLNAQSKNDFTDKSWHIIWNQSEPVLSEQTQETDKDQPDYVPLADADSPFGWLNARNGARKNIAVPWENRIPNTALQDLGAKPVPQNLLNAGTLRLFLEKAGH